MNEESYPLKGTLKYFLENCRVAFQKLIEIDNKMQTAHGEEKNELGVFFKNY